MSYQLALEKAGCTVIEFREFGSYQGTWVAFVDYNGSKGVVEGSYGSCSGCDAFEAAFGYEELEGEVQDKKLADFGANYLAGGLYDKEHYERKLAQLNGEDWFDDEEKEICEYVLGLDF